MNQFFDSLNPFRVFGDIKLVDIIWMILRVNFLQLLLSEYVADVAVRAVF